MFPDKDALLASRTDAWLDALPADDLPPAAVARIESACLAQLRRRHRSTLQGHESLLVALEYVLFLILGCGYLLEALVRALSVYGIHLH